MNNSSTICGRIVVDKKIFSILVVTTSDEMGVSL